MCFYLCRDSDSWKEKTASEILTDAGRTSFLSRFPLLTLTYRSKCGQTWAKAKMCVCVHSAQACTVVPMATRGHACSCLQAALQVSQCLWCGDVWCSSHPSNHHSITPSLICLPKKKVWTAPTISLFIGEQVLWWGWERWGGFAHHGCSVPLLLFLSFCLVAILPVFKYFVCRWIKLAEFTF